MTTNKEYKEEILANYIELGDLKAVKEHVEEFYETSYYTKKSNLLAVAAHYGKLEIVKYFVLERNIPVAEFGDSAIEDCVTNGHFEIFKFLTDHGANSHYGEDFALQYSTIKNRFDFVEYIVDCQPPSKEKIYSSLKWAIRCNHSEIVEYLLNKDKELNIGIDINELFNICKPTAKTIQSHLLHYKIQKDFEENPGLNKKESKKTKI